MHMQAHGIAHGDLQHGNIIVTADGLKLVDYDGMFVPGLAGEAASELGHRNYQHPKRLPSHFDQSIDNFSAWLIYCSIICLNEDASLFYKLGVGDECLLFKESDLKRPSISKTFDILENHANPEIKRHARWMRSLLRRPVDQIPSLNEQIDETVVVSPAEPPRMTQTTTRGALLGAIFFALFIGLLACWNVSISRTETNTIDVASRKASGLYLDDAARSKIKAADFFVAEANATRNHEQSNTLFRKAIERYSIYPESQHMPLAKCWHSIGHNLSFVGAWTKALDAYERALYYMNHYGYDDDALYASVKQDVSRAKYYVEEAKRTSR